MNAPAAMKKTTRNKRRFEKALRRGAKPSTEMKMARLRGSRMKPVAAQGAFIE